ncbi:GDSL family lipase [Paenibacillus sp. sptzw28]|uniref:rhamnogalacturonan acetylesterase n=1 Tax=Paenibacillus sp. sptzw28 TaxID=715179 RepID=UPI001C6F3B17|nr:SGNH/GDSL hydrolase family protein [Paenibacillus sp. sptzw28]QYR22021.1 GDSL family lipase [Paenibacillus sp. sptzw28]
MNKLIKRIATIGLLLLVVGTGSFESFVQTAEGAPFKKSLLLFDCGTGGAAGGYTQLPPNASFNETAGYGFTDISRVSAYNRDSPDMLRGDLCLPADTSLLVNLPDDSYQVTIISGDSEAQSSMSVTAESVHAADFSADAGQFDQESFQVRIEDGQLNLHFSGSHPAVNAIEISKVYQFDFGPGQVEPGYTKVLDNTQYSIGSRFGFADTTKAASEDRGAPDNLRRDFVMPGGTSFDVDLPIGDYQVTLIAGDQTEANLMDVTAEGITKARAVSSAAGQFASVSFKIAIIDGQLNLTLAGANARINALVLTKLPNRVQGQVPNVYLAGDSTVMTYPSRFYPQAGWGQKIANYFTKDVTFTNRAIGGRSSKSFVRDGRLDNILTEIRPNDYLFIQFGHNDASSVPERHTDPYTTYKQYLAMYVDGARQRHAQPVLITPVGRRSWDSAGLFKNDFPDYYDAMKQVAAEKGVPLLDLNARSIAYYNTVGIEESKSLFFWLEPGVYPNWPNGVQDNTHFQEYGAEQIARLVSDGVRDLHLPIEAFLLPAN